MKSYTLASDTQAWWSDASVKLSLIYLSSLLCISRSNSITLFKSRLQTFNMLWMWLILSVKINWKMKCPTKHYLWRCFPCTVICMTKWFHILLPTFLLLWFKSPEHAQESYIKTFLRITPGMVRCGLCFQNTSQFTKFSQKLWLKIWSLLIMDTFWNAIMHQQMFP